MSTFVKQFETRPEENRTRELAPEINVFLDGTITPIPPERQQWLVQLVDAILVEFAQHGYPLPPEAATRVAELERELNALVYELYALTDAEIAMMEGDLDE